VRGFILQPTYRIEAGRPIVQLWGRLETGETFLVRDRRLVPHFYIEKQEAERARQLGARRLLPSDKKTFSGRSVVRVEVPTPPDTPPLRDRLQGAGIECFEADVRFAMRYLIDHGIRGSLALRGASQPGHGVDRVFQDPQVSSADWTPDLSVLSFDIETDPRARRILSIALHGCGASEVLLVTPEGFSAPAGAIPLTSERDLLRLFSRRVTELDPDVLTGWNINDFDFPVLLQRAEQLAVPFALGRGPGYVRRLRAGWYSTGCSSSAAPSSGWSSTRSTSWPARSWERERP
jgi:DNA polymerase-2